MHVQEVRIVVPFGKWGQVAKTKQVLPPDVYETFEKEFNRWTYAETGKGRLRSAYIWQLNELGWTLTAIANAMGVTRERVRQLVTTSKPEDIWLDVVFSQYPLPAAPVYAERRTSKWERDVPQPSERTRKRLLELKDTAEMVRGPSPRYRAEAEEYVALLDYAVRVEKVPIATLAKLVGVTHSGIASRMVRYGYKKTTGKSRALVRIHSKNRPKGRKKR